ncbi:MAG: hypothetical protein OQK73_03010 [Gammaproteobacteria bacterium]|nr:hypothetical protein [Gammaproteobacteria bacterium]
MSNQYSDEFLNAYIDNQLSADERQQLLDCISKDKELAARLCALEKVKDMVQLAYHDMPQSLELPDHNSTKRNVFRAIAASLLLGSGLVIGHYSATIPAQAPGLLELSQTTKLNPAVINKEDGWNIMLHVNSGDAEHLFTVLDEAENLLKTSNQSGRKITIEVLANGQGINLFRSQNTDYARRIVNMAAEYNNVQFLACQIALNRHRDLEGFDVELTQDVKVIPSALERALARQQEGWTYMRI